MKKIFAILLVLGLSLVTLQWAPSAMAAPEAPTGIINPAIPKLGFTPETAEDGTAFTSYFAIVWKAIQLIGGLMVLFYFIWGGMEWIMGHGEKAKVEAARNKMMQASLGFIVLISSFIIIGFIGTLIGYDFLNPVFGLPGSTNGTQTGAINQQNPAPDNIKDSGTV